VKIIVHPAATADLNNAAAFYSVQANKKLGLTLIAGFEKAVSLLSENSELGAPWVSGTRRFVLRRFPFNYSALSFPGPPFRNGTDASETPP
jgi:plasmid stabilization system protein ParE